MKVALGLFLQRGFDRTTLDAIAEAADISRRTFFHYFSSKEAILEAVDDGVQEAFRTALDAITGLAPIDAIEAALIQMIGRYESEEAIALDRLMRSTEALRARKHANYALQERALFSALCEKWPDPERRPALQMLAVACIGAMRVATDRWRDAPRSRPLADQLKQAFAELRSEITIRSHRRRPAHRSRGVGRQ